MKTKIFLGLCLTLVILGPVWGMGQKAADDGGKAGPPAADFVLPNLAGKEVKLSSGRGQAVLLNFWASWCPPCRSEMPSLQKLHELMKGKKFVVLAVAEDQDREQAVSFVKANRYSFPVLLDPQGLAARDYGVTAFPTTYLIDKQGVVRGRVVGATDWTEAKIVKELKKLAAE